MRKYLPVIILFTAVFGTVTFYLAREVTATITKKAIVEATEDKSKESWFKSFAEKDLEDNEVVLKNIKAPFVLVNFWASWCTPCLKEFPELVELRKLIAEEKLYILGINCDEETPLVKIKPIQKKFKFNFPNIIDPKNKNLSNIGSSSLPVTLLFHKGVLIYSNFKQTDFLSKPFLNLLEEK